jgi:hypothetical protein
MKPNVHQRMKGIIHSDIYVERFVMPGLISAEDGNFRRNDGVRNDL